MFFFSLAGASDSPRLPLQPAGAVEVGRLLGVGDRSGEVFEQADGGGLVAFSLAGAGVQAPGVDDSRGVRVYVLKRSPPERDGFPGVANSLLVVGTRRSFWPS